MSNKNYLASIISKPDSKPTILYEWPNICIYIIFITLSKAKQKHNSISFNKSIKSENGNSHYDTDMNYVYQRYDANQILKTILKIIQTFIISDFYYLWSKKKSIF